MESYFTQNYYCKIQLNSRFQKTTFIQVYAPTNDDDKEDFYQSLQTAIDKVPKRDLLIRMGDFNVKVGAVREGRER